MLHLHYVLVANEGGLTTLRGLRPTGRPLTLILRGDAYACAGGSSTQLSICLLNHGKRAYITPYLWVMGMTMCGDKDMAALATIWADNLQVFDHFMMH